MKKFISILLLITMLCLTSVCFAESNIELYTQKLQGDWTAIYYNSGFLDESLNVGDDNWYISGDETGEVFITFLIKNPVNIANSVVYSYRVTFSADESILVLFDSNNNVCGIYTK